VSGICLVAGLVIAPLGDAVTLRWTHSIQKTVWEEDYVLEQGGLRLAEARVRGTGAGMEPPAGAVLRDGAWHYVPSLRQLHKVELRHSPYAVPYEFCANGRCRTTATLLPGLPEESVLTLQPCAHR
jgi:hypothetical protein